MHSTNYIIGFVVLMTSLVAVSLTTLREVTKDQAELNEAIFNKRSILKAVSSQMGDESVEDMSDDRVLEIFNGQVKQYALDMEGTKLDEAAIIAAGYKGGKPENIDMKKEKKKDEAVRIFPFYVFDNNGKKSYIMSVRGNGLWDEIWANVAVADDFNTIVGTAFDHQGETPGLGAEIKDDPVFAKRFEGKKLYNSQGEYVSVNVQKGGARDKMHDVDGISGATVTCNGVNEMLYRGIKKYQPYINTLSK